MTEAEVREEGDTGGRGEAEARGREGGRDRDSKRQAARLKDGCRRPEPRNAGGPQSRERQAQVLPRSLLKECSL